MDFVNSETGGDASCSAREALGYLDRPRAPGAFVEGATGAPSLVSNSNGFPLVHPWVKRKRLPDAASCCNDTRLNPRRLHLAPPDVAVLDGIVLAANNRLDQLGEQLSTQLSSVFEAKRIAGDVHELPSGIRATHRAETFTRYLGKGTPDGVMTTYLEVLPGESPELDALRHDITSLQSRMRETVASYIAAHGSP